MMFLFTLNERSAQSNPKHGSLFGNGKRASNALRPLSDVTLQNPAVPQPDAQVTMPRRLRRFPIAAR